MAASRKAPKNPLIAVVGATGTGKSKLAVDLAIRFNGEIINGDAMQMYKGLPITTNQLPLDERQGIPHHLIGCIDLDQKPWRIGHFKKESLRLIEEIRSRGRLPILVGGTHYYTQSVLFHEPLLDEGLSEEDSENDSDSLKAPNREHGEDARKISTSSDTTEFSISRASDEEILEKLREVDPVMANRWHPKAKRKIKRSLEIYLQTGRPASEIYLEQKKRIRRAESQHKHSDLVREGSGNESDSRLGQARFPMLIFWVHTDRDELFKRLETRVDGMVEQGLLMEAQHMYKHLQDKADKGEDVDRTRGIWVSIGFKELEPYIKKLSSVANTFTIEGLDQLKNDCIMTINSATKSYAKQQLKWIKGKLWKALGTAGITNRLYIVDSTRGDQWNTVVRLPADDITQRFLSGDTLPHPSEISTVASEVFALVKEPASSEMSDIPQNKTCMVCNTIIAEESVWIKHMKGRRHKRALQAAEKRRQRDAYFEQLQKEAQVTLPGP
ncbi:hypothetical protein FQN57_001894 [Myotisia sp. PD_48]|nr:hypothetical protein FQN57_001894 [Myotisia sp. PD_48]